MAGYFKLNTASDGQFFFNLKAGNHETVLTSETYKQKQSALDGIESVKKNSQIDAHFKREVSKKGKDFFTLVAANGQTIGKSEEYSSKSAMEDGIGVVKSIAPKAEIKE
ncbi:MAG: hypothetical protein CVU42_15155 [Chloroflexi bacterium HGW-Chloroflexi-4]|jgi:hypothetical protein|nr:MAG: hypothetical protein CVU42_15155 [Chloroflexi bacterium HGW-Chloroflexi-4]